MTEVSEEAGQNSQRFVVIFDHKNTQAPGCLVRSLPLIVAHLFPSENVYRDS